jgi:outer membrane receptor protein involved in Fe transport
MRETLTQRYLPFEYGMYLFYGLSPLGRAFPVLLLSVVRPRPERFSGEARAWVVGGFMQDDWRVNRRLTLNLGVRYDVETIRDTPRYKRARKQRDNVDPRFGIAWGSRRDAAVGAAPAASDGSPSST